MPRLTWLPLLLLAAACSPMATTTRPATAPAPATAPQKKEPTASAPATTAAPKPEPKPRGTEEILGKPAEAVLALLGAATLDRSEGTARHLQFGDGPCILDVYFYPKTAGTPAVATYAEARMADGRDAVADACVDARLRERATS